MRTRRTKLGAPTEGTFTAVLRAYEQSPQFPKHPGTAANYSRVIRWAEAVLGRYSTVDPVNGIRPKLVLAALDFLADRPGEMHTARAVLGTIDKWAVPREFLLQPITFGVKIKADIGGHEPWTDAQVALALQHASPAMARVILLAVNTGQRGSDVKRMRLTDISEERGVTGINVRQKKTDVRAWIPLTPELAEAIETWRRDIRPPWLLAPRADGQPFGHLSKAWASERDTNEALASLKEAGLVLHGLRGTCVVRLRKAGLSALQIGNMIGMSEQMVARYSRLADKVEMSLAAVHQLRPRERPATDTAEKQDKTG